MKNLFRDIKSLKEAGPSLLKEILEKLQMERMSNKMHFKSSLMKQKLLQVLYKQAAGKPELAICVLRLMVDIALH